jgi:hypothetical protein
METQHMMNHSHLVLPQVEIHSSPCWLRMTNNPEKNTAMNLENKNLRTNTKNPYLEPATSTEYDGLAEPAQTGRDFQPSVKPLGFARPMFVISGVALCMGLASCVVPYDSYGDSSVSVTRYSPGYRVTSLPGGYRSETISGRTYYYHDGYYYNRGSGGYVVVDAPRSSRYYDDYNSRQRTYQTGRDYRDSSYRNDGRYDRTEVITRLPDGYREVNHRGDTYYQAGDRYYRRQGDSYVITTRPY